ncbi:MAG: UvrD-helicase domain-containing protein [Bacteroidaceae bacterium]|nr:UvrD-helicase domain-containing protein [Bacteroidaceae bacterium]
MNLNDLNPSQREAVMYNDGPSLVIAGAGSGKTRVLTYKIAYLLESGYKPWNILALTFTNKAAKEMRSRIAVQVGEDVASGLWMGTFHSIFSRILRREADCIGFASDFTIYDTQDSVSLIKSIIREMQLDDKTYKPRSIAARISNAKNRLILPDAYRSDREIYESDRYSKMPRTGEIYQQYWNRCRKSNVMDFDDLLLYTWLLFKQNPDLVQLYEERFRFVLVDEYQDTNYAQHQIIWLLTQHHMRVAVVGDDAQSIYSFRGANIDNILRFQELYKGARLFKLEENYRSTQTIVQAANSLIHHNNGQIHKDVFSRKDLGERISLLETYSDIDEATAVIRCVREFHRNEMIPYSQMAILYRTNAQSRPFEEAIRKNSIPYIIFGGLSFYQRKEIKDVIAYFRLVVNPHDEEALKRIINYPARGIGQTTLDKVFAAANRLNLSPWEVMKNPETMDVSNATRTKIDRFTSLIDSFIQQVHDTDTHTLAVDIVRRSGIQYEINSGTDIEDISRKENLQEMLDGIAGFVDEHQESGQGVLLQDYLQEVSLLSDIDQGGNTGEDRLTLMTVHSAKGLEFRVVFVVGMEETLFPNQLCMDTVRGLEEERRLFYVAITRAQEYLLLSNAKSRFRFGKTELCKPSRFLSEIDPRFLQRTNGKGRVQAVTPVPSGIDARRFRKISSIKPTVPTGQNVAFTPAASTVSHTTMDTADIVVGSRILHDRFGLGTVTAVSGSGMDKKATVIFDNVGQKQLLLRFAKFKVV